MWVSVLKCLNQFLSLNLPRARRIKRLWIYFSNLEKTENNTQVIHFNEQGKGYKRLKTILKTCIYRNIFLSCLCINMFESRVHGLQKWFKQQWELLKLASVLHWAFKRCIRRQQEMMAQWFSTWGALTYRGVATRVFHVLKLLLLSGIDGKNFLYSFMLNIVNFDLRLILEHFCLFNISDCTNIVFENDSGADETKCNFLIAATKFSAQI